MTKLLDFPSALEAAGVNVRTLPGWEKPAKSRYYYREGAKDASADPAGHMHHHTASSAYTPNREKANGYAGLSYEGSARLYQERYEGAGYAAVYTIANAYPAPVSSGAGDKNVLYKVRDGIEVRGRQGPDTSGWYGNTHYWNTEYVLNGIGAPIDQEVWEMMVVVCQVQNDLMGWTPNMHISHGHHTRRKVDLWGGQFASTNKTGFDNTLAVLRDDMAGDVTLPPIEPPIEPPTGEHEMNTVKYGDGFKASREKQATVKAAQIMLADRGYADDNSQDGTCAADGMFGRGTETSVKNFQSTNGLSADGVVGAATWNKLEDW